jgi:hypothetical protein
MQSSPGQFPEILITLLSYISSSSCLGRFIALSLATISQLEAPLIRNQQPSTIIYLKGIKDLQDHETPDFFYC